MKISKLFATTLQIKTRIIFFTIGLTYNLISGFFLRDFLIFSPTIQVFYLLSVLPSLFLAVKIKSKTMRLVVFILLAEPKLFLMIVQIHFPLVPSITRQHTIKLDN